MKRPSVVVVGAGAFGGWTALHLLRANVDVTLVDAWGPGNARSSSGGDCRVIRHVYTKRLYVDLAARSELWRACQQAWLQELYREVGVLWLTELDDDFLATCADRLREAGVAHEVLLPEDMRRRFPQLGTADARSAIFEPEAGYLMARRACAAVCQAFQREGGRYLVDNARANDERDGVVLAGGQELHADAYVFACGPWLPRLFPEALRDRIVVTRQEVFYFGTPAGDPRFRSGALPVWATHAPDKWYAIPSGEGHGLKLANDNRGPVFDPSDGDRAVTTEGLQAARRALRARLPGMAEAPLLESRVCQYEETIDADFIIDSHPEAANLWLVGGGSGHGFKHGPAVGEHVAELVLGKVPPRSEFSLRRPLLNVSCTDE